jgi:hypothetical protein
MTANKTLRIGKYGRKCNIRHGQFAATNIAEL